MKKKFCKLLALCLSLLCFVTSLVGCGKSEADIVTDDTDYTQEAPVADPAPKKIGPLKIQNFYIEDEKGESRRIFDKKIVDYRMTGNDTWCLTEDGALYKEHGAPFTLELRCLNTGLSDLNYLCEDFRYLFASDSKGNFIKATADEDGSIYSIEITGQLKDGQRVTYSSPDKDDGEKNTHIRIFDQTTGDEYDHVSTSPRDINNDVSDLNGDGKWYHCPGNTVNRFRDNQTTIPIQAIAKGWYLSKDGDMYVRHHDLRIDTDIPSCMQGVKFTKLIGTYYFAYAVADNNDLYVLDSVGDLAPVCAIIHGLSGDLINATYNKNIWSSSNLVILTSEGYYTCEWDYDYQHKEVADLTAQANEELNSVADQFVKMAENCGPVYFLSNDGHLYWHEPD